MADADPQAATGSAEPAASEAPKPYTGMGAGFLETPAKTAPETTDGQPDDAKTQETPAPTTEKTPPDEQERGYLRQADYTRKTQELARQREAFQADMAQKQKEMDERIRQLTALPQRQTEPPKDPMGQYAAMLQQRMADPSAPPEARANAQWELQGIQAVQQAIQQAIEAAVGPLKEGLQALPTLQQQLQGFTQAQQQEQLRILQEQKEAAIEAYGDEIYNAWAPKLAGLVVQNGRYVPIADPVTGDPMTLAELIGRLSGKAAAGVNEVKDATRNARTAAKRQAGFRSVQPPVQTKGGHWEREDAIALIRQTS